MRQRAREIVGPECVFCKSKEDLHFAHVKPTELKGAGRGDKRRYKDVVEHPDCYRAMCRDCHRTFDALRSMWSEPADEIPF